jgi:hypothetical protein
MWHVVRAIALALHDAPPTTSFDRLIVTLSLSRVQSVSRSFPEVEVNVTAEAYPDTSRPAKRIVIFFIINS